MWLAASNTFNRTGGLDGRNTHLPLRRTTEYGRRMANYLVRQTGAVLRRGDVYIQKRYGIYERERNILTMKRHTTVMNTYKYIIFNEFDEDSEFIFREDSDKAAIIRAKADDACLLDEDGEPFLYRKNKPTSRYGCGHDNCKACNGWVIVGEPLTIHGAPVHESQH